MLPLYDTTPFIPRPVVLEDFAFNDVDPGYDQIGGLVEWTPAPGTDLALIVHYLVYTSMDNNTLVNATLIATVPRGTNQVYVNLGTEAAGMLYIIVYAANPNGPVSGPSAVVLDHYSSTTTTTFIDPNWIWNVTFVDTDLRSGILGGFIRWHPPVNTTDITAYAVFLSVDELNVHHLQVVDGNSSRSTLPMFVPFGTNQLEILPGQTRQKYPGLGYPGNTPGFDQMAIWIFVLAYHDEAELFRIVVLSNDHSTTAVGRYFNFNWVDNMGLRVGAGTTGGQKFLRQCRNGVEIWSGSLKFWHYNNGGTNGDSHGRRDVGYADNQFMTGDILTNDRMCGEAAPTYTVAGSGVYCGGSSTGRYVGTDSPLQCQTKCSSNANCQAYVTFVDSDSAEKCHIYTANDCSAQYQIASSNTGTITAYNKNQAIPYKPTDLSTAGKLALYDDGGTTPLRAYLGDSNFLDTDPGHDSIGGRLTWEPFATDLWDLGYVTHAEIYFANGTYGEQDNDRYIWGHQFVPGRNVYNKMVILRDPNLSPDGPANTAPTYGVAVRRRVWRIPPCEDATFYGETLVATVPRGTNELVFPRGTDASDSDVILVYLANHYGHVADRSCVGINDGWTTTTTTTSVCFLCVGPVIFDDTDPRHVFIGGSIFWVPPIDVSNITHYAVYIAAADLKSLHWSSPDMRRHAQLVDATPTPNSMWIPVGTNQLTLVQDTLRHTAGGEMSFYIFVAPFNEDSGPEPSHPSSKVQWGRGPLYDNHPDVPAATNFISFTFQDTDVGGDTVGGTIEWVTAPDTDFGYITHYSLYFAPNASVLPSPGPDGRIATDLIESMGSHGTWIDHVPWGTNQVVLPPGTDATGMYWILIFTRNPNGFNESSTALEIAHYSTSVTTTTTYPPHWVWNLTFTDTDVRAGIIAGVIRWSNPRFMTNITRYVVFMAADERNLRNVVLQDINESNPLYDNYLVVGYGAEPMLHLNTTLRHVANREPGIWLFVVAYHGDDPAPFIRAGRLPLYDDHGQVPDPLQFITFTFTDTDPGTWVVGGIVQWEISAAPITLQPPGTDIGFITHYHVYVASNSSGGNQQLIAILPRGTNELHVDAEIENMHFVIVYAANPYGISVGANPWLEIEHYTTTVTTTTTLDPLFVWNVTFTDQDTRAGVVSGGVSWYPPFDTTNITRYLVFLAADDDNTKRAQIMDESSGLLWVPFPTLTLTIPANTLRNTADGDRAIWIFVCAYEGDTPRHQVTCGQLPLYDDSSRRPDSVGVLRLEFTDTDPGESTVGGMAQWTPADFPWQGDRAYIEHFALFLAMNSSGGEEIRIGTTPRGTNEMYIPDGTDPGLRNFLLVYATNRYGISPSFAWVEINHYTTTETTTRDPYSVKNLTFKDTDPRGFYLDGQISWTPPQDPANITHYLVYLTPIQDLANNMTLEERHADNTTDMTIVSIGTNMLEMTEDLIRRTASNNLCQWIYVVPFAGEVMRPISQAGVLAIYDDNSRPPNRVRFTSLTFADTDPGTGMVGGIVRWTIDDWEDVATTTHMRVFLALASTGGSELQVTDVRRGTYEAVIPRGTESADRNYIIVSGLNSYGRAYFGASLRIEHLTSTVTTSTTVTTTLTTTASTSSSTTSSTTSTSTTTTATTTTTTTHLDNDPCARAAALPVSLSHCIDVHPIDSELHTQPGVAHLTSKRCRAACAPGYAAISYLNCFMEDATSPSGAAVGWPYCTNDQDFLVTIVNKTVVYFGLRIWSEVLPGGSIVGEDFAKTIAGVFGMPEMDIKMVRFATYNSDGSRRLLDMPERVAELDRSGPREDGRGRRLQISNFDIMLEAVARPELNGLTALDILGMAQNLVIEATPQHDGFLTGMRTRSSLRVVFVDTLVSAIILLDEVAIVHGPRYPNRTDEPTTAFGGDGGGVNNSSNSTTGDGGVNNTNGSAGNVSDFGDGDGGGGANDRNESTSAARTGAGEGGGVNGTSVNGTGNRGNRGDGTGNGTGDRGDGGGGDGGGANGSNASTVDGGGEGSDDGDGDGGGNTTAEPSASSTTLDPNAGTSSPTASPTLSPTTSPTLSPTQPPTASPTFSTTTSTTSITTTTSTNTTATTTTTLLPTDTQCSRTVLLHQDLSHCVAIPFGYRCERKCADGYVPIGFLYCIEENGRVQLGPDPHPDFYTNPVLYDSGAVVGYAEGTPFCKFDDGTFTRMEIDLVLFAVRIWAEHQNATATHGIANTIISVALAAALNISIDKFINATTTPYVMKNATSRRLTDGDLNGQPVQVAREGTVAVHWDAMVAEGQKRRLDDHWEIYDTSVRILVEDSVEGIKLADKAKGLTVPGSDIQNKFMADILAEHSVVIHFVGSLISPKPVNDHWLKYKASNDSLATTIDPALVSTAAPATSAPTTMTETTATTVTTTTTTTVIQPFWMFGPPDSALPGLLPGDSPGEASANPVVVAIWTLGSMGLCCLAACCSGLARRLRERRLEELKKDDKNLSLKVGQLEPGRGAAVFPGARTGEAWDIPDDDQEKPSELASAHSTQLLRGAFLGQDGDRRELSPNVLQMMSRGAMPLAREAELATRVRPPEMDTDIPDTGMENFDMSVPALEELEPMARSGGVSLLDQQRQILSPPQNDWPSIPDDDFISPMDIGQSFRERPMNRQLSPPQGSWELGIPEDESVEPFTRTTGVRLMRTADGRIVRREDTPSEASLVGGMMQTADSASVSSISSTSSPPVTAVCAETLSTALGVPTTSSNPINRSGMRIPEDENLEPLAEARAVRLLNGSAFAQQWATMESMQSLTAGGGQWNEDIPDDAVVSPLASAGSISLFPGGTQPQSLQQMQQMQQMQAMQSGGQGMAGRGPLGGSWDQDIPDDTQLVGLDGTLGYTEGVELFDYQARPLAPGEQDPSSWRPGPSTYSIPENFPPPAGTMGGSMSGWMIPEDEHVAPLGHDEIVEDFGLGADDFIPEQPLTTNRRYTA
jgi:hypothetical protein